MQGECDGVGKHRRSMGMLNGKPHEGKRLEEVTYSISAARLVCNSSHRFRTSCSVVRRLPMAIRIVYFPCSLVCERKKWPVLLMRFMMRSFKASNCASSSRPCGWARKHTLLTADGA